MKRFAFILLTTSIFMFSCNEGKHSKTTLNEIVTDSIDSIHTDSTIFLNNTIETNDDISEAPIPKTADELFDDFFFNFASNYKLQKSRTIFPLKVSYIDSTKYISKSEWEPDPFFTEQDYYTLIFDNEQHAEMGKNTSVDNVVVEKIMLNKSTVKNYIFTRKKSLWMLYSIKEMELSQNENASFLNFYLKFAQNPDFQNKSLCESVKFITTDISDDFDTMEGVITAESWPAFAPELPKDIIYNVIYSPVDPNAKQKIFLLRGISNGFEVELYFIFEQGRWKLAKLTT